MSPFVFVTAALLAILHFDIRPKWKGDKKVFWISAAFLAAGYGILTLSCFEIPLPSPLKPVENLVKMLFPI